LNPLKGESVITGSLARVVLFTFLLTFIVTRVLVLLIMMRRLPDLYVYVGGNHVHHLNYGIFLLSATGGCLLFWRPAGRLLSIVAVLYAVGLALTFDEFGMWLHLGGSYWQRASWDAVAIVAGLLALVGFAPPLTQFRLRHWSATVMLLAALITVGVLLYSSFNYVERITSPKLIQIESAAPD
jgi:hypothetical protein